MTNLIGLPLLPILASLVLADHPYYDYSADYTPVGNYVDRQIQRAFDPQGPFVLGISTSLSVPLPDIGSTLGLSLPFSFSFGGSSSSSRQFEGRSLEHRDSLFEGLAKHIAQLPGVDSGHNCLQRLDDGQLEIFFQPNISSFSSGPSARWQPLRTTTTGFSERSST